jgi:T-complex protein 1 subunit zeta
MERLIICWGGNAVHLFDEITEKDLGYAETVYEQSLGEEK